jgi:CheY-like chemotaxis protein
VSQLIERGLIMSDATVSAIPGDRSLLIVEDDKSFLQRLARAMEGRGFSVTTAESVAAGLDQVEKAAPAYAVVDMRLGDGSGLDVISALKRRRPDARGIVLTGYGNIATAVTAVKLGAVAGARRRQGRAPDQPDVGGPGALGAHPAHLRAVRPQRVGDGAAAQHAPPDSAAHPRQAGAEVALPKFNHAKRSPG